MSLKNLPKSLVDSVIEIATQSEAEHQKLTNKFFAEGLRRFGVKRQTQLSEADQKALFAWVQNKLSESSCGCEHDVATEDHMPGDEILYNKNNKMKKQMDEDDKADADHDGDGEVESSSAEYLGAKDKAIKAAMKSEEDSEEVSEEDEVDLTENLAIRPDELATNGAVGVTDPSAQMPVNVDVLRDSDPVSGSHEYRLFVQFNTNGLPTIIPSPVLPGAPTIEALREIVEGLPYYGEAVERALQAASPDVVSEDLDLETPITLLSRQDISDVFKLMRTELKIKSVNVYQYKEGNNKAVSFTAKINDLYVSLVIMPSKKQQGKYVARISQEFGTAPIDDIFSKPFDLRDLSKMLTSTGAGSIRSELRKVDSNPDNNIIREDAIKGATVVFVSDIGSVPAKFTEGQKIKLFSVEELSNKMSIKVKDLFYDDKDEAIVRDAIKTGKTVYVYQNPYHYDINNTITLNASLSKAQAERDYDDFLGDI